MITIQIINIALEFLFKWFTLSFIVISIYAMCGYIITKLGSDTSK